LIAFNPSRTFLRNEVDCCSRKSIYARIQRRPGSEREVRAIYANNLSGSRAYKPQKETGRNSNASQKATSRQELERFHSCRPRPCLQHLWRTLFTRQFAVRQSVSHNSTHCLSESHRIRQLSSHHILAIVELLPLVTFLIHAKPGSIFPP
jgi:hypothetical protein